MVLIVLYRPPHSLPRFFITGLEVQSLPQHIHLSIDSILILSLYMAMGLHDECSGELQN